MDTSLQVLLYKYMFISMVHTSFTVTPHTFDSTSRIGFQILGRIHFGKQFCPVPIVMRLFFIPYKTINRTKISNPKLKRHLNSAKKKPYRETRARSKGSDCFPIGILSPKTCFLTQPTPTDGVVPLSEIGKFLFSLMSYTFFVL